MISDSGRPTGEWVDTPDAGVVEAGRRARLPAEVGAEVVGAAGVEAEDDEGIGGGTEAAGGNGAARGP